MIIDLADIVRETIKYTVEDILDEVKKNKSYVGMIITSRTLDTEEKVKNFYGGEKWQRIKGRTLVGAGGSFPIGTEGGEKEHVLNVNEMPMHDHKTTTPLGGSGYILKGDGARGGEYWGYPRGCGEYGSTGVYILEILRTDHTGGGAAHNNMPPYTVCYIWERIE